MSPELVPVLSNDEIQSKVKILAGRISQDYGQEGLVLLGVLKGAFVFLADLIRELSIPFEIEFIQVASYGAGTRSSGQVKVVKELEMNIEDRHILVVEDIIDSGLTIAYLVDHLMNFRPKSIRVCTFIDKRERREAGVQLDYVGHTMDSGFLVGYGLDYAEKYRGLSGIYHLKQ
jgi:hypoxanthine phosphoribosyltransferase